jgi:hypothetical protein
MYQHLRYLTIAATLFLALLFLPALAAEPSATLYHQDSNHLWNRLHSSLFVRTGPDEKHYGHDRLEPLLWNESEHLIKGKSATNALAVLDEFLRDRGETLIDDHLKRAVLQRDLWLVANWAAASDAPGAKKLLERLAQVIKRVALTAEQIAKLPDNYTQAATSETYASRFDPEKPARSYLPPDLFQADGPWVCLGREKGPVAPFHIQEFNPFNNSKFLVFLKLPAGNGSAGASPSPMTGREATLEFVKQLATFDKRLYVPNPDPETKRSYLHLPNPALPQWPKGTEVALVRRALLIDSTGNVVASPLTESVQFRVMRIETPELTVKTIQALEGGLLGEVVNGIATPDKPSRAVDAVAVSEFQFRRADLFAAKPLGLRDVSLERDFKTGFNAHGWDEFERELPAGARPFPERAQPFKHNTASCIGCHRFPGVYSFNSFHQMFPFALDRKLDQGDEDNEGFKPASHKLLPKSMAEVEEAAVRHKVGQAAWKKLEALLK